MQQRYPGQGGRKGLSPRASDQLSPTPHTDNAQEHPLEPSTPQTQTEP